MCNIRAQRYSKKPRVVLVGVKELQADRKKDNSKQKKLINGIHTGINAKSKLKVLKDS